MAHKIEKKSDMVYVRENGLPWHGMCHPVEDPMHPEEAFRQINGDFEVTVNETFFARQEMPIFSSNITEFAKYANEGVAIIPVSFLAEELQKVATGKWAIYPAGIMPGIFATVREDNGRFLGQVGDRYNPVQHLSAIEVFKQFCAASDAIIDTAGLIEGGKYVWLCAKLPAHITVAGANDEVQYYITAIFNHDGSMSTKYIVTGIRTVCYNTLMLAINRATNVFSIRHTSSADEKSKEVATVLGLTNNYLQAFEEVTLQMAKTKISDEDFFKSMGLTFLQPEEIAQIAAGTVTVEKMQAIAGKKTANKFDAIMKYHDFGLGQSELAGGTVWKYYNTVTGYAVHDWSQTAKPNPEKRFKNLLLNGTVNKKVQDWSALITEPETIATEWERVKANGQELLAMAN